MSIQSQKFNAGSVDDLLAALRTIEFADGVIVSVEGIESTAGGSPAFFHKVGFRQLAVGEDSEPVELLTFTSSTEEDQRLQIATILSKGNSPVEYASLTLLDERKNGVATDIFVYRPDHGAWLANVTKPAGVIGNVATRIPWASGKKSTLSFRGLSAEGLVEFQKSSGGTVAVTAVTDADIDTDGPGGDTSKDRYWQPHTSLRFTDGSSCNSRNFPGVVIPPGLIHQFGIRIGDFALLSYNGKEVAVQVYDGGPGEKIGEISFGAAVALGIYADDSAGTEKIAATQGNSVTNLLTVFFPGSGNGRAVSPDLIREAVNLCVGQWLGGPGPAAGPAPVAGAQTFSQFITSLQLRHVTLAHALGTTGTAPNNLPTPDLWPNIAPTLIVLDAIADHFGAPLHVNSTYRNVAYNKVVGGAQRSQHSAFRAVDFSIEGHTPEELATYAKSLRGKTFTVPITGLQLINSIAGLPTPPPLVLAALSLQAAPGAGTNFVYHGGIQDYDSFVHLDCRGEDVSWG